ncbi:Outer envelope protein 39 [Citrus sinensis]|nr:Outer envelope protein 39 [Citrus sinensis]
MGAQKSIHAGKAKIDVNVDFTHKLCASLMLPPPRNTSSPLSLVIGSLCIKHPNLFGGSEKLDVSWDKGLYDSNVLVAYRRPRPEWLSQQCFVIQHSLSPEVGVHGLPIDNFSRSGSGGVNLSRLSLGLDISEPISSKWSNTTSLKFEFSMQIEQGIPVLSKWLIFNRFKFVASKGVKLGPAFLLTSLTGGSIVGDMAPYQAFAIGGLGSVRGYGEGAVGSGRSCLVANTELTFPLFVAGLSLTLKILFNCFQNNMLEGAVFMDCGTDLGSGRLVPGNPALRQGKPGSGAGLGYGLRYRSPFGSLQLDCAINAFQQKTLYFGITNLAS